MEENKMTASNLGIIFGPTLIRPRQTDATISLSSLVDYPYQARIVELLVTYYDKIFDVSREMVNPEKLVLTEDRELQQIRKSQSLPVGNEVGCFVVHLLKCSIIKLETLLISLHTSHPATFFLIRQP